MQALLMSLLLLAADDGPKGQTPGQQYEALLKGHEAASAAWHQRYDEESAKADHTSPLWAKRYDDWPEWAFIPRFLQLAEANPTDQVGVDASLWIVGLTRSVGDADKLLLHPLSRALDILIREHLQDERAVLKCLELAHGVSRPFETFFRAVLQGSRDRTARGRACLALAHCLSGRAEIAQRPWFDHVRGDPTASFFANKIDADYVHSIRTADQRALLSESDGLLERVMREFGDIKSSRGDRTLAEAADAALYELRNLLVGKVAPEIEGEDIGGKPMRLSDHQGRVVAVVFWGTWCGPCMGMVPHERSLVKRLQGQPFALLGVNSDADRGRAQAVMEEKGMTWPSWWDGGKVGGPIASRWNVTAWPTIYVLDGKGVIRFKQVRENSLDEAVDTLLEEMRP
jgi:thiol-disulfide isomerase/thioredoxin